MRHQDHLTATPGKVADRINFPIPTTIEAFKTAQQFADGQWSKSSVADENDRERGSCMHCQLGTKSPNVAGP